MVLKAIRDELFKDMPLTAEKFAVTVLEDPWTEFGFVRLPPPINPNPTKPLDFSRPAKVVWAIVGMVIALHGVLFAGLLARGSGAAHYQRNGLSSGSGKEGMEVVSMLSLIPEEPVDYEKVSLDVTSEPILESIAPQAVAFGAPNIRTPSIEPPKLSVDNNELDAERMPQVIYRDQIRARIERTWYEINGGNARLAIGGCEVKIVQSAHGDVKQVEFQNCIALPEWRASLESAIRQASPLPAPPEAKVFADEVTLEF